MRNKKAKTAFSIIELSIVVVIISALIGGVVVANRMYENAKLATAQTLTKFSSINDIEGLTLWLETTMPQSFNDNESDDGETITTWYDLSDTKKIFTGTATYSKDGLNNLPVLGFNGIDNNFIRSNSFINDFVKSDQGTVFLVQKYASSAVNTSTISWQVPSTFIRINIHALQSDGYLYFDFGTCCTSVGRSGGIPANFNNRYNIISLIKYPSSASLFINGSLLTSNASATSAMTSTSTSANFYIGSGSDAGYYFIGNIAEIIIFERALNEEEIESVEKYLSKKWGIAIQ